MSKINITNIRKREAIGGSGQIIDENEASDYLYFEINELVDDSQVEKLYLRKSVITDIHDWVMASLEDEPVKEVGGFLLGRYTSKDDGLEVSMELFVPARNVDFSSASRLKFGSEVLLDLANEMEESSLLSVGWFHTHPGHTAYLSSIDMNIHEVYYTHGFQIAIVLDSLTDNFTTGIFTRKKDKSVNNQEDIKKWISWKTLIDKVE